MLASSEEQNSAPEEAVKSLKTEKSPEIVVESDTEESTSEVATSTVQSSQPDDSEPTTVTDQDYLGDESSSYLNTNAECSDLSSSLNVDENFSDRTSPSKSIPEIPGSLISESESELRDKLSTPGLDYYEEFSNSEISEAKIAEPPEPHTGSPIRDVLLALQNEAIKYRNIQVMTIIIIYWSMEFIIIHRTCRIQLQSNPDLPGCSISGEIYPPGKSGFR